MRSIFFKISSGGLVAIVFIFVSLTFLFPSQMGSILPVVLIAASLFLVTTLFFSWQLSETIEELINTLHKVSSGNFNVRILSRRKGELKQLVDNFNDMVDKFNILLTDSSRQRKELNSIITSLQEGLLVIDREGKILLSNESFKRIAHSNSVERRFYWEVIREPALYELVNKVRENKDNFTGEVCFLGRTFSCSATFLEPTEKVVLIFHDITEVKNMEKVKRDFVAGVSHELRTPLTAITGFVETLEEEIDDEKGYYTQIIKRHTERLVHIVQDLLLLSEVEDREVKLQMEEVNLQRVVESVIHMFAHETRQKNLNVSIEVEESFPPSIRADPFKLEQIFINLIDNAIKYTERGKIHILLKRKKHHITVEVRDTGIGIPQEHLPRIFERFYTVDKSRSRRLGGTGLGLSIVKHIVLLHGGSIDVKSRIGEGTTFSIILPIGLS